MKKELFHYSWSNIKEKKIRSTLSILSILIGIAAIFTLISFGQGLTNYVDSLSSEMGMDKIMVQPKSAAFVADESDLDDSDLKIIRKINGVKEADAWYMQPVQINSDKENKYAYAINEFFGDTKEMFHEMMTVNIEFGRDLEKNDHLKVVLGNGYSIDDKIFKKGIKLNDKIKLNEVTFEVVGFFESIGNPQDDGNIYLTKEDMEFLFPETINAYQAIIVRTESNANSTFVAEEIERKLRKHKGQEEGKEKFYAQTFEQLIAMFSSILIILNTILILIAGISLFVAGVNIMNTMYTSVLERTKEIGIMKSIGAKNSDILKIFMIESAIIGLLGGIFGIMLGYTFSWLGTLAAKTSGYSMLQASYPLWLIVGCIVFATFVSCIAGILPAIQASKQSPVDSLRYE